MTRYNNTRSIITITFLGLALSLMMCVKITLGFIPGIELTTFVFVIFCLFLRIKEIFLLTISYLILVSIFYGFGTWILAYWIVYPIDAIFIIFIKKIINNKIIFSAILFVLGFLFLPAFFISDSLLYTHNIAVANAISSLPICLIGGLSNLIAGIIISPMLIPHLNQNASYMYINYKKINFTNGGIISKVFSVIMIASSFVGIGEFYYNFAYFQSVSALYNRDHRYKYKNGLLPVKDYNRIKSNLKNGQVAIVGEYNNYTFQTTVNLKANQESLGDIIFDRFNHERPFKDNYNPGNNKYFKPPQFYFKIAQDNPVYGRLVGMMEYRTDNGQFRNFSPYKKIASIYTNGYSNMGADFLKFNFNSREVIQIYY